jgi:hypothetical protein
MAFAAWSDSFAKRTPHGYPRSCLANRTPDALTVSLQALTKMSFTSVPQIQEVEYVGGCKSLFGGNDMVHVRFGKKNEGMVDPSLLCPLVVFRNFRTEMNSALRTAPSEEPLQAKENDISNGTQVAILGVNGFWTEIAFIKEGRKCIGWVRSAYICLE